MSGEVEQVEGQVEGVRAVDQLHRFVARIERLSDEIADLQADRRDVMKEAESNGFDLPALREVLRRRKIDPRKLAELDGMVEVYEDAVRGMPRGTLWGGELRAQPAIAAPKRTRRETLALAALAAADAAARADGQ